MNNLELLNSYITKYPTQHIVDSKRYYRGENTTIRNRKMQFLADGAVHDDLYKANVKFAKNDYRTIVDQLTGYLMGKQPTLETKVEIDPVNLWQTTKKALKQAQIQAIAWAQPRLKDGKMKFHIHKNSDNIIPIYANNVDKDLEKVIFHYVVQTVVNSQITDVQRAEIWDDKTVTYYENVDGWGLINPNLNTNDLTINPMPHVVSGINYTNGVTKITKENSWGMVPFIPLELNEELQTMLEVIGKEKIDALDFLLSDGCNNFLDLADAIYIIQGWQGDATEALLNLKNKKIAAVDEGGDLKQLTNEIPMVSRKTMIDIVVNAIYSDGQAVNMEGLKGSSLTNVVIKAWFATLDIKADNVTPNLVEFYGSLLQLSDTYNNNFVKRDIEYKVKFNKTIIINEIEYIDASTRSTGTLSNKTRWESDPRVTDTEEEQLRVNAEDMGLDDEV